MIEASTYHFSVLKITEKQVFSDEVRNQSLNRKKSSISSCIPVKHLTESVDIYRPFLTGIISQSLKNAIFPGEFKWAEVISVFKKTDPFDKINCRPVSLLSQMSKVFERLIFNLINEYIEPFLSNLLTGFRESYNKQHCLLKMLEKWKDLRRIFLPKLLTTFSRKNLIQ